ncbi:kelch-like protein 10 [Gouania willdenowi]|nr:kelch-like protein 10 [Gouania willdenowi]
MDKSYVRRNVLNNEVVKTNPESHVLVYETLKVMPKPSLLCSESGIINTLFCRRLPNAVLLMFRFFSETIEAFDYRTNSWITVHTHPSLEDSMTHLFLYSTVFLGRCFYIVGGGLSWTNPFNRVWRFNLVTHTWQEMSPMQESRDSLSVTVLKGCIYAVGGFRNRTSLRTAERYQPNINQWTFIASMNERRSLASCTTLNNKIYICGGQSYRELKTAEYYNPDTNQWTLITPMGTPRCGLGVVAYMGHIFAVGGRCGFRPLRSAEAYNPVTNTWYNVSEMVHTHSYFGIAVMNRRIFVVSCRRGNKFVECYDKTTNTWSVVFSGTDHSEYDWVSCCVISRLPNMAEYCSPREPIIPRTQV